MDGQSNTAEQNLISAFRVMQPTAITVGLVREVGGGTLSTHAQRVFLEKCLNDQVCRKYPPSRSYARSVLKNIILAAEGDGHEVLEDLYKLHSLWLEPTKEIRYPQDIGEHYYKTFSYMIPDQTKAVLAKTRRNGRTFDEGLLTLKLSLNMFEGDTGCFVWPAGLFLTEFLLTYPQLFQNKSCLELGSGTGISGIWLSRLAPSKVLLTDGDLAVLNVLRHNLAINGICSEVPVYSGNGIASSNQVECHQLLWETATAEELKGFDAEVIVGADLLYDPGDILHLVRVFAGLLRKKVGSKSDLSDVNDSVCNMKGGPNTGRVAACKSDKSAYIDGQAVVGPVAYLATAVRNLKTFNLFLDLASTEGLEVVDVTESMRPNICLRDIVGFDRTQLRIHKLTSEV